jgi:hypothetical protein
MKLPNMNFIEVSYVPEGEEYFNQILTHSFPDEVNKLSIFNNMKVNMD